MARISANCATDRSKKSIRNKNKKAPPVGGAFFMGFRALPAVGAGRETQNPLIEAGFFEAPADGGSRPKHMGYKTAHWAVLLNALSSLGSRDKIKRPVRDRSFYFGAADEARTRYLHLGKVALYQMSYSRIFYRAELISAIFIIAGKTGTVKRNFKKTDNFFSGCFA